MTRKTEHWFIQMLVNSYLLAMFLVLVYTGVVVAASFTPYSSFGEFESKEALDVWCKEHLTVLLVANSNGVVDFQTPEVTNRNDCDDYAERFQILALNEGYLMSLQIVEGNHMGNLAMIGNDIYYIEPNPFKHEIRWLSNRD